MRSSDFLLINDDINTYGKKKYSSLRKQKTQG